MEECLCYHFGALARCAAPPKTIKERTMPESKCPNVKTNLETCPCTEDDCPRHGVCCECIRAHVSGGSLPACARRLGKK